MFLVLVDDATRYTTIFLVAYKSDAASSIIQYDKVIFNKTGRHLSIFQSDGGEYFITHGIHQRSSTPYTPEQNGRAERVNRTILKGTSAMLLDCQLPWEFWGLAAEAFVYLKHRSPHVVH
jgi:hypothetical protein